jgi:hypothetical protein
MEIIKHIVKHMNICYYIYIAIFKNLLLKQTQISQYCFNTI